MLTDAKAAFIRNRALNRQHYFALVEAYLDEFGEASRADIEKLLFDKLADVLSPQQKTKLVANLLQELRKSGRVVRTDAPRNASRWRLPSKTSDSKVESTE